MSDRRAPGTGAYRPKLDNLRGVLWMLLAVTLLTAMFAIIKQMATELPFFVVALMRTTTALVMFIPWLVRVGRPGIATRRLKTHFLRSFFGIASFACIVYAVGRALMLSGRLDEAVEDFDLALELDPGSVGALVGRGEARTKLGLLDDALEDLERAVSLDPDNAEAHTKRGNVHRERGDLDLAVGAYDRALFLERESVEALIERGSVLYELGQREKAILDFKFAEGLTRQDPIATPTRTITLDPSNIPAYVARGLAHLERGDASKAISDFNTALAAEPDNIRALVARGDAWVKQFKPANALEDYSRAIGIDGWLGEAYRGRGIAHYELGRFAADEGEVDTAIAHLTDAIADLAVSTDLMPSDAESYATAARAYGRRAAAHMDNQGYEAALADYSEAIALAPGDAESHAGRAAAAAYLGRDAEADADAERAVELGFNRFLMAAMLAEARRDRG